MNKQGTMRATYIVTTKNGETYKWKFTEGKSEGDYGNGIYVAVKSPSGDISVIDCRYVKNYDFAKKCVEWLLTFYGENLDELYEED